MMTAIQKVNPGVADTTVYVVFEVTEPNRFYFLCLCLALGMGKQGFYGTQTMNFHMSIAPTVNRACRSAIGNWEAGN